MAMKKSVWDMILKVVIAVASAYFKPIFQHRLRLKLNAISSVF